MIWSLVVGLVVGYLASLIVKGRGSGCLINILVGIVGGFLGGWLFRQLGVSPVTTIGNLLASLIGAIVLLLLARIFSRS